MAAFKAATAQANDGTHSALTGNDGGLEGRRYNLPFGIYGFKRYAPPKGFPLGVRAPGKQSGGLFSARTGW